ncbi:hypothetical protein LCGC14_2920630, partial [marine sediment metagenome]
VMRIERPDNIIPVGRQAKLLGVARSTLYYEPVVDTYTLELMRLIDEEYTKAPLYGSRKITAVLRRKGYEVNRKRIQRLMRLMGIEAIYPKPNTSRADPNHKIYPYLLRDREITRVNEVWGTDISLTSD